MVENWEEWVLRCARCNVNYMFAQLQERVEQDVSYVNSISDAKKNISSFRVEKEHGERFVVILDTDNTRVLKEIVVFENNSGIIGVEHLQQGNKTLQQFNVDWKWNEKECKCELFIDDEPHEVWQVSQKALLPIFFPALR